MKREFLYLGIEGKNGQIDKFIFMFKGTEFWESLFNIEKKGQCNIIINPNL